MKKSFKNLFGFIIIGLAIYFWTIFLIIFGTFLFFGSLITILIYKIVQHISKYNSFDKAKANKPFWFIFGNSNYIRILEYIREREQDSYTKKDLNIIDDAMMFLGLGFYRLKDISKADVKRKWKETQKIYHPDSGTNPDINKSQLANKYKDLLLREIERNV